MSKNALVCGAGGFIGSHLVTRLKGQGWWVRGADLKYPRWDITDADDFILGDLRDPMVVKDVVNMPFDRIYQLAADMGGAGYLFTGENDASVMYNSALINLNVAEATWHRSPKARFFYSSSACVYPKGNQEDPDDIKISESSAYPADPDSEYGWEKLFSERLYAAYARCRGLDARIARFHNIYGPQGSYNDGREKAPAALCRKVAEAPEGGTIVVWGDGQQTRSFLYIEDCLDAVECVMTGRDIGPVNIGSEEMVTIDELASLVMKVAAKPLQVMHVRGPVGVRARTSDNTLMYTMYGWMPHVTLKQGIGDTYAWIETQVKGARHE